MRNILVLASRFQGILPLVVVQSLHDQVKAILVIVVLVYRVVSNMVLVEILAEGEIKLLGFLVSEVVVVLLADLLFYLLEGIIQLSSKLVLLE